MDPAKPGEGGQRDLALTGAHIGKSVTIKGELSGSENLFVDGEVEGSIQLNGHSLTIGQHGRVRAEIKAKDVVVQGRVDGNVTAGDHLDLRKTAIVIGDMNAQRIAVEDGAFMKGKVETTKTEAPRETRSEPKPSTAAASSTSGTAASEVTTTGAAPAPQVSGAETRR